MAFNLSRTYIKNELQQFFNETVINEIMQRVDIVLKAANVVRFVNVKEIKNINIEFVNELKNVMILEIITEYQEHTDLQNELDQKLIEKIDNSGIFAFDSSNTEIYNYLKQVTNITRINRHIIDLTYNYNVSNKFEIISEKGFQTDSVSNVNFKSVNKSFNETVSKMWGAYTYDLDETQKAVVDTIINKHTDSGFHPDDILNKLIIVAGVVAVAFIFINAKK